MSRSSPTTDSPAVDWTRTDDGVELFEDENPDAWVRMTFEAGTPPEHRLFMVCEECGAVVPQRSMPGRGAVCGDCGAEYVDL